MSSKREKSQRSMDSTGSKEDCKGSKVGKISARLVRPARTERPRRTERATRTESVHSLLNTVRKCVINCDIIVSTNQINGTAFTCSLWPIKMIMSVTGPYFNYVMQKIEISNPVTRLSRTRDVTFDKWPVSFLSEASGTGGGRNLSGKTEYQFVLIGEQKTIVSQRDVTAS